MSDTIGCTWTEIELTFLYLALDEYETFINHYLQSVPNPNTENMIRALDNIKAVRNKFHNKSHDFTLNELKVMYGAVDNRRDFINDSLDQGFSNVDDQEDALAMLKVANSIIRRLKTMFSSHGIDIESVIG